MNAKLLTRNLRQRRMFCRYPRGNALTGSKLWAKYYNCRGDDNA